MAIKNFLLFNTILIIFSSILLFFSAKSIYAEDPADTEQINNNYKTENSGIDEDEFLTYDYKIKLQEEFNYDKRNNKSQLNPNNDFYPENNYYNRMLFDIYAKLFLGKYFDINFRDQGTWKWQENEKYQESDTKNYLQELFLTTRIYDTIIIDIGRENFISGVAYGWNPTDYLINAAISSSPDPRILREQRLGACLVKSSLFFNFGHLTVLFAPEIDDIETNKEQRQLYKITANLFNNTIVELLYFRERNNSFGSNLEISLTDNLIIHFEGSVSENNFIYTVNHNNSDEYNFIKRNNNINIKSVFGLNYTLPDLHNIIIEFYYNQEGLSKKEWNEYFSMLECSGTRYNSDAYEVSPGINPYYYYIFGANRMYYMTRISRYYLFLRLSKQNIFIDNFNYSVFSYINLYDKSAFINFNPEYSFSNNFTSGIFFSYYYGKNKSEFGISPNLYSILYYFSVYF